MAGVVWIAEAGDPNQAALAPALVKTGGALPALAKDAEAAGRALATVEAVTDGRDVRAMAETIAADAVLVEAAGRAVSAALT